MTTQFIVSDQTNPYLNLAVEQYLLNKELDSKVILYLWKNRRTVVIGRNQNPYGEVDLEALAADGGYLMRRKTGGGAVYHDDGNQNFTFVAPKALYDQLRQFGVIQRAVESYGLHTELSGRNDILVDSSPACGRNPGNLENDSLDDFAKRENYKRKFSGNAFSKGLTNNLHHGTILISGNMADLQRYLKPKPAKLMKHGVDSVRSRVVNLAELDNSITTESITVRLLEAFEQIYGSKAEVVDFKEIVSRPEVERLYKELSSDEWLYGGWQSFDAQRSAQFDWGGVEVSLSIDNGVIKDVKIASDALDVESIEQACNLLRGASQAEPPMAVDNVVVKDIVSLVF